MAKSILSRYVWFNCQFIDDILDNDIIDIAYYRFNCGRRKPAEDLWIEIYIIIIHFLKII